MNRLALISVAINAVVFALLLPIFEANSSHLTNPLWPSHARLHEAWQLLTNASVAIFALYLIARRNNPGIAISLCLITCVSFLVAWVAGGTYGGSMLHSDGTQMAVAGINVAVLIVMVLTALLIVSGVKERQQ